MIYFFMLIRKDAYDEDLRYEYTKGPWNYSDGSCSGSLFVAEPITCQFGHWIFEESLAAHAYYMSEIPYPEIGKRRNET